MSSITVTSDDALAQQKLQRLAQIVARPAAALNQSAQASRRLVQDTFRDERDPWGGYWQRHAAPTVRARNRSSASGQILLDTGRMYGSIDAIADDSGVTVGVGTEYASYHQFGNPNHRAWGGKVSPLAQRAFLPESAPGVVDIPAPWWYEILFPVEAAIERAAGGA